MWKWMKWSNCWLNVFPWNKENLVRWSCPSKSTWKAEHKHSPFLSSWLIFALCCFCLTLRLALVSPRQQLTVEDQEAPMEKKRLVRLKEMQVPPAPLCPRMQEMPSPGSLTTARSLRRGKRRRAVMKRWGQDTRINHSSWLWKLPHIDSENIVTSYF